MQCVMSNMSGFIDTEQILERLKTILQNSGLTNANFAKECAIPASSLSQILNGSNKLNVDTINKIIARWGQDYPPLWFLLGESYANNIHSSSEDMPQLFLEDNGKESSELIQTLLDEITRLKAEVKDLQNPKEVERIMVYYTDKSYQSYSADTDL